MKPHVFPFVAGLLLLSSTGCRTLDSVSPPGMSDKLAAEIAEARSLYESNQLAEALVKCVDIQHRFPDSPALTELQGEIMTTLNDRRTQNVEMRREDSITRGLLESEESLLLPSSYGMRRAIEGSDRSHVREDSPMAAILDEELSLHFDSISLAGILEYLGREKQLNLIADPTLDTPPVTIHAENITIGELFDFLARNLNVSFNFGKGVVWITQADEVLPGTPLLTRLYRLRHGIPTQYLTEEGAEVDDLALLEALDRFVPLPEGADFMFDDNSQILLVKNTERNLRMVDRLVEAMDITQPQVLIEARFVSTNVSDLRELGVDWLLQSDVVVSESEGATRTQFDSGGTIGFGDAVNAGQGLNATFTGILTDPQFQAVIHALELQSDARTLSAPRVIAANNRPSYIRIGRDISYVSDVEIERESFGTGENRDELLIRDPQIEILETGYELRATPSVGLNRRDINLHLQPEITELIRFREVTQTTVNTNTNDVDDASNLFNFGGIEFPEVARRLIETELVIQSGETVVMGGLLRHRDQDDVSGVPLLSSLPFVGKLFQRNTVRQEKDNLLVFVTATLISKRGEDLVPLTWDAPIETETRGRVITDQGVPDETIAD